MIEQHFLEGAATPRGYSHGIIGESGRLLHLAGMAAINNDGSSAVGLSLEEQTELTIDRILKMITQLDADPANMVRRTTYVVDLTAEKTDVIQTIYARRFGPKVLPAATMLGVTGLARPSMDIEIECTLLMA